MEGNSLVFVYGTLRKGFQNHSLIADSKFIAPGKTSKSYELYVDEQAIPYAVVNGNCGSHIVGELYLVDENTLKDLDVLEEHPDWYSRTEVGIFLEDGRRVLAWMYFYPEKIGEIISSGDYAEWLASQNLPSPPDGEGEGNIA